MSTTLPIHFRKASHGRASNATSSSPSKAGSVYSHHSRNSKATSSTSSMAGAGDNRPRPTFWSIFATRRMARVLTSRLRNRTRATAHSVPLEATYRMEPDRKFNRSQVEKVIRDVLEAHLHDFTYQAKRCPMLSRVLTEEIKDRVKALDFDR